MALAALPKRLLGEGVTISPAATCADLWRVERGDVGETLAVPSRQEKHPAFRTGCGHFSNRGYRAPREQRLPFK